MKKYYEILGLNEDATLEEVNDSFTRLSAMLYNARKNGEISRADYATRFDELEAARDAIVSAAKKEAEEAALVAEIEKNVKKEADKAVKEAKEEEKKKEEETGKKKEEETGTKKATETKTVVKQSKVEKETGAKKSGLGWKIAAVVLTGLLIIGAVKGCQDSKKDRSTGAYVTGRPAVTETIDETKTGQEETIPTTTQTPEATETQETQTQETQTPEDYSNREYVVDLGSVQDETLVRARAQELADQLNAAGIVCPRTGLPYEVDQLVQLIQFVNGVYIPDTQEEIDILYFDALDLSTAQMNTQYYMDHINYAMGMDDVLGRINSENNVTHVTFSEAFVGYNGNGAYPLIQWIEQKRIQAYSTTDRAEKDRIMYEVFQVLADLMKGNGCTITIYDGKEAKEGIEYTFTADQVLANPSAAFFLMGEAKQILMNCGYVDATWTVYNRNNTNGVDENGQPILVPDTVSQMEIQEYYNNGCYDSYQQAIDENYPDGKTFAQITQMKIEALALNNFEMGHNGKSLGK